jgi:two-component system sensor histidine kinase DctS
MSAETLPNALFPLTFWAALRLGMRDTSAVLLICGGAAIWFHAMGMGPFVMPRIAPEQTFAQFGSLYLFLAVLCVTSLLAAAAQSERTGAEALVRASEQRYRMLIERMNEGVNITDAQARMVFVSDRFCEMTGYAREELIGHTGEMLTIPELKQAWRESHVAREAGRAESHALVLKRKDGQLLHVWISPKPQFDAAGAYIGSLNVVLDVTDRRRAEEKARSHLEQLAHVARVASMGEMASAIAHEINQPLTAIANYANAALRLIKAGKLSPEETADTLQRLATEAERAGAVVRKMRGFVRSEEGHLQAIGVDALFADVLRLTRAEAAQYEVDVTAQAAETLPAVLADTIQIEQVLLNLVRNAMEAIEGAGATQRRVVLSASRAGDGMIEIQVRDTGPGLTAAAAEKVFEPFYTTKNEGIGIGLALSRSIVDAHGGRLWADASSPGAVFRLTLPIAEESHAEA